MHFLFQEGTWEGTGRVSVSGRVDPLLFTTRWMVTGLGKDRFRAVQTVSLPDHATETNVFTVTKHPTGEFDLLLENEVLGIFSGQGVCDAGQLAWEFTHYGALEGLEVYNKGSETEYAFRAEYVGADDLATTVRGTLTKVVEPSAR